MGMVIDGADSRGREKYAVSPIRMIKPVRTNTLVLFFMDKSETIITPNSFVERQVFPTFL
jgi:hypothetical protein